MTHDQAGVIRLIGRFWLKSDGFSHLISIRDDIWRVSFRNGN